MRPLSFHRQYQRRRAWWFQFANFLEYRVSEAAFDLIEAENVAALGIILAVNKITKVQVIDDCDQIVVGHRMSLTMSCDHRVIDGALGAEYLKELRHLLENPALLLV